MYSFDYWLHEGLGTGFHLLAHGKSRKFLIALTVPLTCPTWLGVSECLVIYSVGDSK
jgi:hypothetical protein